MWALWRNHDVFQRGTLLDADGRPVSGGLPDGEIPTGTPTPALVPMPGLAMAPMPRAETKIVDGQLDLDGNGTADFLEGWPTPTGGNPGYPFYIPGVAGHRPPTSALDMTDPADIGPLTGQPLVVNGQPVTPRVYDGGLPRHVITGGAALSTITPLDLSKVLALEAQRTQQPRRGQIAVGDSGVNLDCAASNRRSNRAGSSTICPRCGSESTCTNSTESAPPATCHGWLPNAPRRHRAYRFRAATMNTKRCCRSPLASWQAHSGAAWGLPPSRLLAALGTVSPPSDL
jgi:hypothetical protein